MGITRPFVFSPSQVWDGNDGFWSTFILRVGTPAQMFRVLPSTAGQETFVPVPQGCLPTDPDNCGDLRGVYPVRGQKNRFGYKQSSTWKSIGLYELNLAETLNYTGNGIYVLDTVGLMVEGGLVLENQVVAGIAAKDFFLGVFGLRPQPSNFSDFDNPQQSFMQTLKEQNKIPSISYAYTAGASYRMPKIPGSLILGGYDQTLFKELPGTPSFHLHSDDSQALGVVIQSITASDTLNGTITLSDLERPILAVIESTVPHLWLPRSICDRIEQAFGLSYDPNTDLYLFNNTEKHNELVQAKPEIVIALGNDGNIGNLVRITLPFAAFDLQVSWPTYSNETPYFPMRRASNDSQYTLGRAFLQEAYIIVDHERSGFVHQRLFQSQNSDQQEIITIHPPESDDNETTGKSPIRMSNASIAGIVIGSICVINLFIVMIIYLQRRSIPKRSCRLQDEPMTAKQEAEIMGEPRHEMPHSLDVTENGVDGVELESLSVYLISDDAKRYELTS